MRAVEAPNMSDAPVNVLHMSKMIQVRNVPDDLHRMLKIRAAAEGMTLSDYIKRELSLGTRRRTIREIGAEARALPPSGISTKRTVEIIREGRGD
jgi:antitoxin FitA